MGNAERRSHVQWMANEVIHRMGARDLDSFAYRLAGAVVKHEASCDTAVAIRRAMKEMRPAPFSGKPQERARFQSLLIDLAHLRGGSD